MFKDSPTIYAGIFILQHKSFTSHFSTCPLVLKLLAACSWLSKLEYLVHKTNAVFFCFIQIEMKALNDTKKKRNCWIFAAAVIVVVVASLLCCLVFFIAIALTHKEGRPFINCCYLLLQIYSMDFRCPNSRTQI